MKISLVMLGLTMFCGLSGAAAAEIYSWIDADGVRHFSNHAPPEGAKGLEITAEVPYVEPAAEELQEARREAILEKAREEMGAMEAESLERLKAAERQVDEARQKAQRALEEAEERLQEAEEKSTQSKKTNIYSWYMPYLRHRPDYKKEPMHSHYQVRPGIYSGRMEFKKRLDGRQGISIRNPLDRNEPRSPSRRERDSWQRRKGFSADKDREFFLRFR